MAEPELNRLATLLDEAAKLAAELPKFMVSINKMTPSPPPSGEMSAKDVIEFLRKAAVSRKLQQLAVEKPKLEAVSPGRSAAGRPARFRASTISASSPPIWNRTREKIDLHSPLEKVLKNIKGIKSKLIDENDIADMDYVVKVIVSNELYRPNLDFLQESSISMDSETKQWLASDYLVKERSGPQPSGHGLRSVGSFLMGNLKDKTINSDVSVKMSPEIEESLEHFDRWTFNIFDFDGATQGRPLFYAGYAVFKRLGLLQRWRIEESALRNFLTVIESGYIAENPYHNAIHAADVTHALYLFMINGLSDQLEDIEVFAAVVAAIIHDFQHPGLTNAFQIKTESEHALVYNDKSVLENYHLASAFTLIRKKENNIFLHLTPEERQEVRENIISMVLATDMSVHFDRVTQFKAKLATGIDTTKKEDRSLVLQMAIKCADISAQARPLETSLRWSQNVADEFFRQGDKERDLKLPISPFMDRNTSSTAKSQLGFIDFIVSPAWEAWITHLDRLSMCREYVTRNRTYWEKQETKPKS